MKNNKINALKSLLVVGILFVIIQIWGNVLNSGISQLVIKSNIKAVELPKLSKFITNHIYNSSFNNVLLILNIFFGIYLIKIVMGLLRKNEVVYLETDFLYDTAIFISTEVLLITIINVSISVPDTVFSNFIH